MGLASEKAIEALRILRTDFNAYAKTTLKIKTKSGAIEPLLLNRAQLYLHQQIEAQRKATGKVRCVGLKGRQQGFSTYTEGRLYWLTSLNFGKNAYILTHEQAATDNLFGIAQRYHDHAPIKPVTGTANAKELHFGKLDSGYKVGTAGAKAVGRSGTIHYFHGSEVAFWPNAQDHFAGVMQCIPDAPGTEVILESTANGIGGKFYDLWVDAINGRSDYIAVFVPWFWQDEYRKDASNFEPDAKEQKLAELHGLDNEQLAWRRAKIAELGGEPLFNQEYPCTWEEAFIASGRKVFDIDHLHAAKRECWPPAKRLVHEDGKFVERANGELRQWFAPEDGKRYVIGADVAEGLEHGDYSCVDVLEVPGGNQVAQWHGHCAPDILADIIYDLAKLYNYALVGVERNNHGLTTLTKLRDDGYPHLYTQRMLERRGSGEKETKKFGWLTTQKSKFKIIDQLSAELRENTHGIACIDTVNEMFTYIVEENGSYNAQEGCNDDRVIARAIAGEMLRAHPAYNS